MNKHNYPGLFIAFEGLDGSGSSSQVERLKKNLRALGYQAFETKEPTNNMIGGLIRGVLTKQWSLPAEGFQLLFAADRSHHLAHTVMPHLENGHIVISDRYAFSTIAFGSLGVDEAWLEKINEKFVLPDITILLRAVPEVCMERIGKTRTHIELFEESEKLKKVWNVYQKLANDEKNRIFIIDGEQTKDEVEKKILVIAKRAIAKKKSLKKQTKEKA